MKRRGKTGFVKDENGSATIEAVLWMPVFVFVLVLIFDVSMMFYNQTRVMRIVHDANRAYAVGRFDQSEAEAFMQNEMARFSENADVQMLPGSPFVRSQISVRAGDLGGVGMLKVISGVNISVVSHQMVEG